MLAIGWDRAPQATVLGQSLDFPVSLRLDPGDAVAPECVAAEVTVGDSRLPPPAVRVAVDGAKADSLGIRVMTTAAIDEPFVAVTVAIGCPARMWRRFVLLADPAPTTPVTPVVVLAAAAPPEVAAPAAPALSNPPPAPSVVRTAAPREPAAAREPPAPRKARKPAPAPAAEAPAPVARLKLEAADPPPAPAAAAVSPAVIEEAMQAVALAASSAKAAASAASAAQERVEVLESTVAQLRSEANANRDLVAQLRASLAAAEGGRAGSTPLLAVTLGLLLLAAWLGWRVRQLGAERQRAWRAAAAANAQRPATPTSQLPMVNTEIPAPPTTPGAAPRVDAGPVAQKPWAGDSTQVLPVGSVADPGAPRDVSIEELLDLEQQAEFFIVLGQDDAAVDLLVDHLRNTGGGSPLPYLKLLEIYRRRDERDAYERTRARFNHRFNAYAPGWDADLQGGRSLDDYAGVIPRLQQVWPRPLDAMAELEALLFRKSRGELFDLPAYREVLFLYSLARDLLDREAADGGNVDLLLPLADGGEFSATSPHPYFGSLEHDSVFDAAPAERPSLPLDFDLSQPETPPAIERP